MRAFCSAVFIFVHVVLFKLLLETLLNMTKKHSYYHRHVVVSRNPSAWFKRYGFLFTCKHADCPNRLNEAAYMLTHQLQLTSVTQIILCVFPFFVEWILTDRSVFLFWHCRFQCRCPWWPHQQRPHSSCSSSRRHSSRSSLPSSSKPCSSSRKPSCYTRYYIFRNIWQTRVLSKSTSNTMSLFSFL